MIRRISLILLFSCILFATDKTFVREYTYQASDYDSKVTSRANALEQVKRLLLEEVSMFIKSEINMSTTEVSIGGESELKDFYENKITSITAGITETKILEEKWNGVEYWMKAEITIDPDDVDRKVSDIVNSREKLKAQIQVPVAFFAAAAGASAPTAVGLPIAAGTLRPSGSSTSAFVWFFRRTNVSPYTQFRDSGI